MAHKNASMRTDVARVRHLGSAHGGTRTAWLMRVTAAALFLLTIAFVTLVLAMLGLKDYDGLLVMFKDRVAPGLIALLFMTVSCYHMKMGMQTIIEDYVHDHRLKEASIIGNILLSGLVGAASALAIIKLTLN